MSGLWDQKDIPHKGWVCEDIEDVLEDLDDWGDDPSDNFVICEMCQTQRIRYIHTMKHENYDLELHVGCECAAQMELDGSEARARETNLKKEQRWVNSTRWETLNNGDFYLKRQRVEILVHMQTLPQIGRAHV